VLEEGLQGAQHRRLAVAGCHHAVDEIGAGQVQAGPGDLRRSKSEQLVGVGAEQLGDVGHRCNPPQRAIRTRARLAGLRPQAGVPT